MIQLFCKQKCETSTLTTGGGAFVLEDFVHDGGYYFYQLTDNMI